MKTLDKVKALESREFDNVQCDLNDAPTVINTLIKKGFGITKVVNNGTIKGNRRVLVEFI